MTQLKWTAHCFETNPSIFWYLSTPWCLGIYRYCYMCMCFVVNSPWQKGFAADRGSLEMDSRVLGDLVLPLIV